MTNVRATPSPVDVENFAWDGNHDDDVFLGMGAFPSGLHPEAAAAYPNFPFDAPQFGALLDPFQSNAFLLGPSSDPDPFFRGRYAFDATGSHQATLRRYQRASASDDALFAITPQHRTMKMADTTTSAPIEPLVDDLLPFTARLYKLFDKFVYPVFPLPVKDSWQSSTSTLGAAVCATALGWRAHDATLPWAPFDIATPVVTETPAPDADCLHKYVWACISREMHAPSYDTIQAALLLIERRIPLTDLCDSPFNSCLQAAITSMAFSLGLHRNPDTWEALSEPQKQKRRTLWWLVFVEDRWVSAAAGKPVTIRENDYDVATPIFTFTGSFLGIQFEYLLSLTLILQDILDSLMHWRFWSTQNMNIPETLSKVGVFQNRLEAWRNSIGENPAFPSEREPEGSAYGVLIVAHLYCHLLLQKTLIRATSGSEKFSESFQSALSFSLTICKELSGLGLSDFTSFWFSWSHSHFNAFSEFLPYLISVAPTAADQASAKESATRLRQWLFTHGKYIDLVRVAMSRLDLCLAAVDSGNVRLADVNSDQLYT
ncbi:Transcription factor [Akanthomyces lecanii RCEF 1005]|uniref:Transcription factor n=1 Tax=Akanthomyces lecanii RCEF 1005 TaxID=1081108 RepID=A0A162LHZ1_CORDF|nr:Transcription factor [Akanthomyces lecanii RCEF 1005]